MKRAEDFYLSFNMEKKYHKLDEEQILKRIYEFTDGQVEVAVSRIINEAVLAHMNLNIDSTIMQMLSLNDYLIGLFIKNLHILAYNYMVYRLEEMGLETLTDEDIDQITRKVRSVNMKTDLGQLNQWLDEVWGEVARCMP